MVLRPAGHRSTARRTTWSCTPRRSRETSGADLPLALGDPPATARDRRAGDSGPGLPVNPVSPEDAVDELLRQASAERGRFAE